MILLVMLGSSRAADPQGQRIEKELDKIEAMLHAKVEFILGSKLLVCDHFKSIYIH